MVRLKAALWLALVSVLVGCAKENGSGPGPGRGPRAGEIPASTQIEGKRITSGFAHGHLRLSQDVAPFRVSDLITVSLYEACVDAGGCSAPSRRTFSCDAEEARPWFANTWRLRDRASGLPAVCLDPGDAEQYCRWVGAELPSAREWLLSARGDGSSRIAQFAWGDDAPNCERHPGPFTFASSPCCKDDCKPEEHLSVGQRPAGASPSGVADVLLTPAELIGVSPDAQFPACRSGSGCLVTGMMPGAIEGVRAVPDTVDPDGPRYHEPPFGFRCVWKEGNR